jgi:zinc protease
VIRPTRFSPRRLHRTASGAVPPLSRRHFLAGLALGTAGVGLSARAASSGTMDASQIKEIVYPSGLRLVVKESRATSLAAVQVWIRAGGFLESPETSGTAHVIEHLVFKGADFPPGAPSVTGRPSLDDEIENLGGELEATTQKDWTYFTCTLAGRFVPRVLASVGDVLRRPLFREQDLTTEKPILEEELRQVGTDPERLVSALLYQLAYKKHPYGLDQRGSSRFIKGVTLAEVRPYYQKYYVPSNMTVVVVGDVSLAEIDRATRVAFLADKPGPKDPVKLPPDEVPCSAPERRAISGPFTAGYLGLAFGAPSVKEQPDVHAMDILVTLLESGGMGRLPRLLRGNAGVQATFETRRQSGLLTITAAAPPPAIENVEALIRKELDTLVRQPLSAEELSLAKRTLKGSYALDNETYSGQAGSLGYYAAIDRWQFASEYLTKVDAVTAEQLHELARKYLAPEKSVSLIIKPRSNRPPERPRTGT